VHQVVGIMPRTCWVPGCTSGYRTSTDTSRHLFSVPANKCAEWNRKIPREGILTSKHYICDLHFEEQFIKKQDEFVISGKTVYLPRDRWMLNPDAVPTLFPNLPHCLPSRVAKRRTLKRNSSSVAVDVKGSSNLTERIGRAAELQRKSASCELPVTPQVDADHCYASQSDATHTAGVPWRQDTNFMLLKIKRQATKIRLLNATVQKLSRENKALHKQLEQYNRMPENMKMIVNQTAKNHDSEPKPGNQLSDKCEKWIIDSLLSLSTAVP
jgi:hypothetical protein